MAEGLRHFEACANQHSDPIASSIAFATPGNEKLNIDARVVGCVAKARGIAKIAKDSGFGRESLYKTLTPGAKPRYETLRKIVDALGVKWTIAKPSVKRRTADAHA